MTNADLAARVDTSDEWIVERTGIRERHIATENETTGDLAVGAAQDALKAAGVAVDELDLIVCATTTPDNTFPAMATAVQRRIGMKRGAAFDVQAVCSGFVFAMATADNFVKAGQAKTVLVIGAETMSRLIDWNDRGTCVLFGDGAGAVVLRADTGTGETTDRGVLSTHIYSDGRMHEHLYVDGGPSTTRTTGHLRMHGREVFKHAVTNISQSIFDALDANALTAKDIDWFVPHQANKRILDGTAKKVGVAPEKMVVTVDRHGNTSAASIPLALHTAITDGRIKAGDLVLMEAMGGGFTWGSALVRWG
jgi:3-oxoacyl-[acyl-carrier-protein] synthase-3